MADHRSDCQKIGLDNNFQMTPWLIVLQYKRESEVKGCDCGWCEANALPRIAGRGRTDTDVEGPGWTVQQELS
jgi:hypothetical protein